MKSSNYSEDEKDFTFFDLGDNEDESQYDDSWLRLESGDRVYVGYQNDLCEQCFQNQAINTVDIGQHKFRVCDQCRRWNFPTNVKVPESI